jgi:predicted amidohydrolase YtcJ
MASTTLIKNATLWRWSDGSSTGMKTGRAIPRSWFCVDKGAITVTSTSRGASETEPPSDGNFDSVIDAKHQLVIPGLHDAHIHVAMTGESNYFLNLKGCDSINNMICCLSAHALKYPVSVLPWISGVNWDQVSVFESANQRSMPSVLKVMLLIRNVILGVNRSEFFYAT